MLTFSQLVQQDLASWSQLEQHVKMSVYDLANIFSQLRVCLFFATHACLNMFVAVLVDKSVKFFSVEELEELTMSSDCF